MIAVKAARLDAANEGVRPRRSKTSSASSTFVELTQKPRPQLTAEQLEQRRARVTVLSLSQCGLVHSITHICCRFVFAVSKLSQEQSLSLLLLNKLIS